MIDLKPANILNRYCVIKSKPEKDMFRNAMINLIEYLKTKKPDVGSRQLYNLFIFFYDLPNEDILEFMKLVRESNNSEMFYLRKLHSKLLQYSQYASKWKTIIKEFPERAVF